eukprot:4033944-Alexandrium_andersonii.AAC.1
MQSHRHAETPRRRHTKTQKRRAAGMRKPRDAKTKGAQRDRNRFKDAGTPRQGQRRGNEET